MKLIKLLPIVFIAIGVTACSTFSNAEPTQPVATAVPTATSIPPTPTPLPRHLTICLGEEPESLFLYNGTYSQAMLSVLETIYDGPIDYVNYQYLPVILETLPDLANGGAVLNPVQVSEGMALVDADGNLMNLHSGVRYIPSGCKTADCVAVYDGKTPVTVDQLSVTFKIKAGINWSDGTPVTAQDSVFSYNLAVSPKIPASKGIVNKTSSYSALDDQTVQWVGKPGFMDQQYAMRFWLPLPSHQLSSKDISTLTSDPTVTDSPLGWGPFVIQEWVRGDHITAVKNPAYFRSSEGLPAVDILTFRFTGTNSQQNIQALLDGKCDVLDQSTLVEDQAASLLEMEKNGKLKFLVRLVSVVEMLHLDIKPASYDDGYFTNRGDRPDIFGEVNVRKAVAMCINRDAINMAGQSLYPASYQPAGDPLADIGMTSHAYDPVAGSALLEQSGWRDSDKDPSTPRVAFSVKNVPIGSKLEANFVTTNSGLRMAASEKIAADLQVCGFRVNLSYVPPEQLFAAGPDGLIFGRKYDMALFTWGGVTSGCRLFETSQIPSLANYWIGSNVTGYSSAEFDSACQVSRKFLPGQAEYIDAMKAPQLLFVADLPAIPLYQPLRVQVTRAEVCGLEMDSTARSGFWRIEQLNYGEGCP